MPDDPRLADALARTSESDSVDFKLIFDPATPGEWQELIKDIVAMANTGGGVLLFGISDDGVPQDVDLSALSDLDIADVANKLNKYTGVQFGSIELVECKKDGKDLIALVIGGVDVPLVFVAPGTYPAGDKQQTAFARGTVYFRHAGKSEPGTSDDFRQFLERRLGSIRRAWLDGIAKIVEAPTGARIAVLPPETAGETDTGTVPFRLVDDPQATPYYAIPVDKTHPHRQKELVVEVNKRLGGAYQVTTAQILWVRRTHPDATT